MENDGFVSSFFGNSNHFNSFPLFHFLFHLKNRNKNGINQAFKLGMYGADYVWILHEIIANHGGTKRHMNAAKNNCKRFQRVC